MPAAAAALIVLQYAREVRNKIPEATQDAIRQQWESTGRMAVTCGPADKKQHRGIFALDAAGKPVILVPTSLAAAASMQQLVAGGSSVDVPCGYKAVQPQEFESMAGCHNTRNWQQSIRLEGER